MSRPRNIIPKGCLRHNRLISRHGKGKALTIVAKRLGIAVYYMLKRKEPFNEHRFLNNTMISKQKI